MRIKPKTLALVLAGGRVDDLGALTYYRPKSALPFGGFARIIDFSLSNLMGSGLERVGILSQYRSYSLINHIGIGAAWDMIGRYRGISILPPFQGSNESRWYQGTADAVFQNLDFIRYHAPENVLIIAGDHIYNMDYQEMIEYHREKDADLTIAFLKVPLAAAASRFGVAEIAAEAGGSGGRVLSYEEKPASPKAQWASLTIYCFRPQTLYEALATNAHQDASHEFGKDIIPRLLREKRGVHGFKFRGYWGYTGTIAEYWQTNMDLLGDKPKIPLREWGLRTNLDHRRIRDCPPWKTGAAAVITNSLIYNGCTVEGAVENSILFPRVEVGRGAIVRDSIVFFNNKIAADCRIDKTISDVNNTFGPGCIVGAEDPPATKRISVIGLRNTIPAAAKIGAGAVLYPGLAPEKLPRLIPAGMVLR
jgi:glucose-1-phosphate adenylyltransferase